MKKPGCREWVVALLVCGVMSGLWIGNVGGLWVEERSVEAQEVKAKKTGVLQIPAISQPVRGKATNGKPASPAAASQKSSESEKPSVPTKNDASSQTTADATDDESSPKIPRLPLFENWGTPEAALILTGRQAGYIEPCGCTGLANQKGGLVRRHTLLTELRQKGWTLIPMDVGNQVKRFGRQSEIKFQMTYEGLKLMDYQAIGLGPDDLRLSTGEVFAALSDQPSRFVSANAAVLDRDLLPRSVAIEANGRKVGVTSVLGDEYREKIRNDEVLLEGAVDGIRKAWTQLQREECDFHVLLVYGTLDETHRLARQFPQFDVIVTTGGGEEPPMTPEFAPNSKMPVIQVGGKGMFVGVIGLYPEGKFRYQRVPLDDRYKDSPKMLELIAAYQDQLQAAGLDGLGVKPLAHPSGRTFVGSETCGECHTKAMEVFLKTPHAKALDSLVHPGERSDIARHYDPECLSCHVTGWDPQRLHPFKSGYLSLQATAAMAHNGCENCHGPGSAHVAAEQDGKSSQSTLAKLRLEMRLPYDKARDKCVECHDLDNSPGFQKEGAFEKYMHEIEHKGKD